MLRKRRKHDVTETKKEGNDERWGEFLKSLRDLEMILVEDSSSLFFG